MTHRAGRPGAGTSRVAVVRAPRKMLGKLQAFGRRRETYTAGSYHPGVALAVNVDGSVHVISESIDNGDLTRIAPLGDSKEPSPYGTWGQRGTIFGQEVTDPLD